MRGVDPALFPNVVSALQDAGLDPTREPIPVSPASHYMMGGVVTDLHGRSTVPGLYAVGETACTGLHGANRLASNSLSECFVFGARAADAGLDEPAAPRPQPARRRPARRSRARRARRRRRCGATPGSPARARASSGCAPTRIRSRGSSPPARCAARRAAARTSAPIFRALTPRSTTITRRSARATRPPQATRWT